MLESVLQEKEKLVEELERVKQEKSQSVEEYKAALKTLQESYEKWVYFIALYSFLFVCVERLEVHSRRPTVCLSHIQTCDLPPGVHASSSASTHATCMFTHACSGCDGCACPFLVTRGVNERK